MHKSFLLAIAALALGAADGAKAQGAYWPWCAYYDAYSYNCGFATLGQCVATVRGVGGWCRPNPFGPSVGGYDGPRRAKPTRRR